MELLDQTATLEFVKVTALQEVTRSLTSTVQIELEGVRLGTSLRVLVQQLRQSYCVRNGSVIISSPEILQRLEGK